MCVFPDLSQEAAATNEDHLRVGSKKATLGVRLCYIEEMYVVNVNLCQIANFVIPGFEVDGNKSTTYFCLWKVSHQ